MHTHVHTHMYTHMYTEGVSTARLPLQRSAAVHTHTHARPPPQGTAACGKGGAHKGSMAEGSVGRSSGVHVTASPALHELLGLLTNLMPGGEAGAGGTKTPGSRIIEPPTLVLG